MRSNKNGQIFLYFHFNKIVKEFEFSFQSPALSQRHVRDVCKSVQHYLTKSDFDNTYDSKKYI